ncbi:hypothetical protein GTCCBUS3UF5_37450 [Geobacillus thermoleovorans CCB_US3_UF5]|uniref:Uncharacterized protein n=3 Tax=Geobacillus TaxID=129337 RepID=A0A7U9JE32_GEOTM|nr:hypothetical protein GTCCBUS3UF5_37450 [Geobacillus thermoleovorans CCB_US3_UF5]EQB96197.1 hypothetical protein GA8_07630 [Geobacillus sp. A8]ESU73907.1 hypothetical protein T260_00100 [Geobacillus sp. MAS1]GAD12949.1 hypothetical protein GBL_1166 [Geobacillus kaustophilus GBlys]GAJ57208.1 hypothetical protein B23_0397 [Geobacillus thermoleovorans B23]
MEGRFSHGLIKMDTTAAGTSEAGKKGMAGDAAAALARL